ncbi:hypothetical protein [Mycolicibacterium poriferae]|uniref:hypothetical protein n=1 Tax=Mycolicibacterium poriferae TaxID=39694 RepID=UPI0024B8ED81|nr:hypothetical protein [Mycolicibacterium poriferae]
MTTVRTATEFPLHRRPSPIGTVQRHYQLTPEFSSGRGGFSGVVLVPGEDATFLFPADETGEIADYEALARVTGVIEPDAALSTLGYCVGR